MRFPAPHHHEAAPSRRHEIRDRARRARTHRRQHEDGKLELEASLAAYRRGTELMKHCQSLLADAEQQIRILENGELRAVDRDSPEVR